MAFQRLLIYVVLIATCTFFSTYSFVWVMVLLSVLVVRTYLRQRDLIQPTALTKAIFWYAAFTLVHSFLMYFLGKGGLYELLLASRVIIYPAVVYFATVQVSRHEKGIRKSINAAERIAVFVMVGYLLLNLFPELTFFGFIHAGDFSGSLSREGVSRFLIPGEMFLTFYAAYFLCKVSSRFDTKYIILLPLGIVAATLTYARSIWLAITLSFVAFWSLEAKISKKVLSGIVVAVVALVLLAAAPEQIYLYSQRLASIVPELLAGSSDPTTTVTFRYIEVQQGLEKFVETPILGVGIGMPYRSAAADLFLTATEQEWKAYLVYVHDGFVDVLVHQGIIGFLLFLTILYQVFVRLRFSRAFPFRDWSGDLKIVWYCLLTFFPMALGGGNSTATQIQFTMFFFFFFALLDANQMNLLTRVSAVREAGSQA
jgi:O-antigen ligase